MIAMARPRIGLALGSGSARRWSHIGIIESLIEAGIEPAIVCRTSIGSLVGAAYIAGRLGELRAHAHGTRDWRVKDKIHLLKDRVRDTIMETCCGLHNFRLQFRPWNYGY
jgi:predicted acylesterase/phospholipase RssA